MAARNITSIIKEVQEQIRLLIENDIRLAPKFLRLAFHDAVSLGCLDMNDPENLGLEYPILALEPLVQHYRGFLSQADVWVTASLVACEVTSNGWGFPMYYYGRGGAGVPMVTPNSEGAEAKKVDECQSVIPRPFPSVDITSHDLLQYFAATFGFSTRETIVVMGAHTIGEFARSHSGFNDGSAWVDRRHVLDNEYYAGLVGGSISSSLSKKVDEAHMWEPLFLVNEGRSSTLGTAIPDRFMWTRGSEAKEDGSSNIANPPLIMTNADIALVRDLKGELDPDGSGRVKCDFVHREDFFTQQKRCPAAGRVTIDTMAEFRHNNTLWLVEFERVLRKMFTYGYDIITESDNEEGCESKCLYLVNKTVIPPPSDAPTMIPTIVPTQTPTVRPTPSTDTTYQPTSDISNGSTQPSLSMSVSPTMVFVISISATLVTLLGAFVIILRRRKRECRDVSPEQKV